MPGTFTTDLVPIQLGQATADYVALGQLKTTISANDDYFIESTLCISFGVSSGTGTGTYHLGAKCLGVRSATVAVGGSGYVVGDRLQIDGGTVNLKAIAVVATLSGSAVATVTVAALECGSYTVVPTNPAATTALTGVGTGCTLNLTTGGLDWTGAGIHIFSWIMALAWPSHALNTAGGLAVIVGSDTTESAARGALSATVAVGGSGYSVNDVLTVVGGTGTAAQFTVTAVSGGAVTAVSPVASARGLYTIDPTNPVVTTVVPAGGSGCTLNLTLIQTTPNMSYWFVGGSNVRHEGWTPYTVSIDGTPDFISPATVLTSVDLIGVRQTMVAVTKLITGVQDRNAVGTGSTIIDGTGRAPVTLSDYQVYDNNVARAWGVVTFTDGTFLAGGKLYIGKTTQTAETIFWDSSIVIVYRDMPVQSGFYEIRVVGASGQETTFRLGKYSPASGLTSNGCVIKGSGLVTASARTDGVNGFAHSFWKLTASAANQVAQLYACTFSEMLSAALAYNTVSPTVASCTSANGSPTLTTSGSFDTAGIVVGMSITGSQIPANTYVKSIESATSLTMDKNATGNIGGTATFSHTNEVRGCTFVNSGTVTANGCVIDKCTFQDLKTVAPISATYALVVANETEMGRITNSTFINCNKAIQLSKASAATYEFVGIKFSGNAFDLRIEATTGTVIINVSGGGDTPTYQSAGAAVTINNNKVLTLSGLVANSEVRIYTHATQTELAGVENSGTSFQYSYNYVGGTYVDIVIHKADYVYYRIENYLLLNADTSIPIAQQVDRNYSNPP